MTHWPDGPSLMAERIRTHDWGATALGPSAGWPQSLRTMVDLMLGAPGIAGVAWGPALSVLFNDEFAALMGPGAGAALGRPFGRVWPQPEGDDIASAILAGRARYTTDGYWDIPHRPHRPFGWFTSSWTPLPDEAGAVVGFYLASFETTDRVLAEKALREREEQQAFLLGLADALRPLADPAAIQGEACRRLGEHLGTDHAYYVEIREAEGVAVIEQDHVRGATPSFVGTYSLAVLHWLVPLYRQGDPIVVTDMRTMALVQEPERSALAESGIAAWIAVPLVKRGELVGALSVVGAEPRAWSAADVALVVETGERIWAAIERARSAREAEIRLRTMADAAPVLIWDVDATGMVFVNDHYLAFFGVSFERVVEGGWKGFLHPDDAEDYIAAYSDAYARRRPYTREARVRRADGQYRWLIHSGRPLGADRYVGVSIDVTERREAEERLKRNNAVLQAINRIFSATLGASSEADLARIALEVAGEITDSALGVMGEVRLGEVRMGEADARAGRFEGLAGIDRSRDGEAAGQECAMALGRAVRILSGPVLAEGRGVVANDPAALGDGAGAPEDGPPLEALLGVPLRQGDAVAGLIGLANRPGGYRREDLEAVEALAPAIWHALMSKRGEALLRESEARFRQFAEASADILWIIDAETFASEFASSALRTIYGLAPEDIVGDARLWALHVVPEDRDATFGQLQRVRGGEVVVYEFRILRPTDGTFRWIRNHGFPLFDEDGQVRHIGGISSDVTEARLAEQHQRVLLAELQHRVRNIMALVRSIVARTGERAESVGDYAALLGGRLLTLARIQSRLTRAANAGVAVSEILRDEIDGRPDLADRFDLDGDPIALPPKAAEVLTLAVHELVANAVRHGALSRPEGRVSVRWRGVEAVGARHLDILWTETGGPDVPVGPDLPRRGFGSDVIERQIPYELGGEGRIEPAPAGIRCRVAFPLTGGASLLETGAPRCATVFGGVLDTIAGTCLAGHRILVALDDFYRAGDVARALERGGATVLGPFAGEAAALDALDGSTPTGAVIDLDLGGRPALALARALAGGAVPFVVVIGYGAAAVPPEFEGVPRLETPADLRRLVDDLARALGAAATGRGLNPA